VKFLVFLGNVKYTISVGNNKQTYICSISLFHYWECSILRRKWAWIRRLAFSHTS